MSVAGIRSNRGDGYQTLIALDWALTVLSNPQYEWIEIDSAKYPVDDVVIGGVDSTLICCQCKKNQKNSKAWSIYDLSDELNKAYDLLANFKNAQVRFYSRDSFGTIAKLREHSITQADESSYQLSLNDTQKKVDTELSTKLTSPNNHISTYEFLNRIRFETSSDFDRIEEFLHERLRYMVSNPDSAYDAIWKRLDYLGARLDGNDISSSVQHRLTEDDLKDILQKAGAMLSPPINISEVNASFASTSSIGRSWRRDIAGKCIPMSVINKLSSAINEKKCTILLTGKPGSGKTCTMLALQDYLEAQAKKNKDIVPLFIQSREFADFSSKEDREAQGLPTEWVEKAARLAEEVQVIVVIDSLDVLSIAREHRVLTYFLAQIDRLLSVPNITVVTACRDFDRHYDKRIAERKWDCEIECLPLNWEFEIEPLLVSLSIDPTTIDSVTRELITNPRELTLFVDLAKQDSSFNVVTSQELAQRYLNSFIRADDQLGERAIQAIEVIATEMLQTRKLSVPQQTFTESPKIKRILCSLNVLQVTRGGNLTFGHQTLLDILVISEAIRRRITLNEFIQNLQPVPFVRPAIRNFVNYLATGEAKEFRKQLRTVLTGDAAFHIRRLVAELFAEQKPQDDDWSLIRDLRNHHREVFQVIYMHASRIEWHYFWFKHLVPILKDEKDIDGLSAHTHRISLWKDEDQKGIIEFWVEIFELDWVAHNNFAYQLTHVLAKMDTSNIDSTPSLFDQLLNMPREEHTLLGHAITHCLEQGAIDDTYLWRFIAGDIEDEDVTDFRFDNKLHCQSHEFGKNHDNFLHERMTQSIPLLELALESIERWSDIYSTHYGKSPKGFNCNFLSYTSYEDTHTKHDLNHKDSENILFDAIQTAIINHAKKNTDWWRDNRERLCFNHEGALRYFAILSCSNNPETNSDLIGTMLKDKMMMASDLSYELGSMIKNGFIHLDADTQDEIMEAILSLWDKNITDEEIPDWVLKERAKLISTIPIFLRSPESQQLLTEYEESHGKMNYVPDIYSKGGIVLSPFSFEVFLNNDDSAVLRLLKHYSGYERDFGDDLVGGERSVGIQLRDASSRAPSRFLNLLIANFINISESFRNDIMGGVTNYLAYNYGNLRPDTNWNSIETPDAILLAVHIIDELERHNIHWYHNRAAANAIEACARVIDDNENCERLIFLAIGFASLQEGSMTGESIKDPVTTGLNMVCGDIIEGMMILLENLQKKSISFPELLIPTLRRFAANEHPGIRALILRRLPYLQSRMPDLGWDLFNRVIRDGKGLWTIAERCLYYAYHNNFETISPFLLRIRNEGKDKDLETWGRISALAAFSGHVDISTLINDLEHMQSIEAWRGATSVWAHPENIKEHKDQCIHGLEFGLFFSTYSDEIVNQMKSLFYNNNSTLPITVELMDIFFDVLKEGNNGNEQLDFYYFGKWLNAMCHNDPDKALSIFEKYLTYVRHTKSTIYDYKNNLTQIMTRLFAEAEEREESDRGAMLQRVVLLQDSLLSLGIDGINDWLKAAERP